LSIHFSGWSTSDPPLGEVVGDDDGDADDDGEELGEGEALLVLFAVLFFLLWSFIRNGARFLELDWLEPDLLELPEDADGDALGTDGVTPEPVVGADVEPQVGDWEAQATRRDGCCAWRLTVSTRSLRVLPGISTTIRLPP